MSFHLCVSGQHWIVSKRNIEFIQPQFSYWWNTIRMTHIFANCIFRMLIESIESKQREQQLVNSFDCFSREAFALVMELHSIRIIVAVTGIFLVINIQKWAFFRILVKNGWHIFEKKSSSRVGSTSAILKWGGNQRCQHTRQMVRDLLSFHRSHTHFRVSMDVNTFKVKPRNLLNTSPNDVWANSK